MSTNGPGSASRTSRDSADDRLRWHAAVALKQMRFDMAQICGVKADVF